MYKKLVALTTPTAQKKLTAVAIAVGGALAAPLAFGQVVITGKIVDGLEMYHQSNTGSASYQWEKRVSDQSSRVIITDTEDLGNGFKGWFQIDSRISLDNATNNGATCSSTVLATNGKVFCSAVTGVPNGWGVGNSAVGIVTPGGRVSVGRWDLHYDTTLPIEQKPAALNGNANYNTYSLQNLLGWGLFDQVNNSAGSAAVVIEGASRANNVVQWDSPNWFGFTSKIAYSTDVGNITGFSGAGITANAPAPVNEPSGLNGGDNGATYEISLKYSNFGWLAGADFYNEEGKTAIKNTYKVAGALGAGDERAWTGYVGYNFPFGLNVGAAYNESKFDLWNGSAFGVADQWISRKGWLVPVSFNFGPNTFIGEYSKVNGTSGATNDSNSGANAFTLGYEYNFSKRTAVGLWYTRLSNQSNADYNFYSTGSSGETSAVLGARVEQIYLGLYHAF